jgi:hypothetical protein
MTLFQTKAEKKQVQCQVQDWPSHKLICNHLANPRVDLVSKMDNNECIVCFKKTTNLCGKCGIISFCSKECQVKEWPSHGLACNVLPFPKKNTDGKHVYVFYFPENSEKVVLGQVKVIRELYEHYNIYYERIKEKEFFNEIAHVRSYRMVGNRLNDRKKVENTLRISFNDDFGIDGSKSNKIVQKMTKGSCFDWRGPILISKVKGVKYSLGIPYDLYDEYLDVDFKDFSLITDYFLSYGT